VLVRAALAFVALVYLHNTVPHLTMLPRVNVDEPWLMERAYQVLTTGVPTQPMLRLARPYFLQVGYDYLYAPWFAIAGVGMLQARLLSVLLGLGAVLLVAGIARRLVGVEAGVLAAAFLAADSNFLGNARTSRTDMPSVFFAALALYCFLRARDSAGRGWHFASGASAGAAMLCHGNAYWAVLVIGLWYVITYGVPRVLTTPPAYLFAGGLALTFGPYVAIVMANWTEVKVQIGNFAGDRAPSLSPSVTWSHIAREGERYRNWYFGLITNDVPNPLLWAFQIATLFGIAYVLWRVARTRGRERATLLLAVLVIGVVIIFAGFIPNKAHVYMPNLLLAFSIAAGTAIAAFARFVPARVPVALVLAVLYSVTSVAYYEKWYATQRASGLEPFEATERSIRALVSEGPKDVFASPNFWTPFHDAAGVRFVSYTGATPMAVGGRMRLDGFGDGRPIFLLIDESEWRTVVTDPQFGYSADWREAWTRYIEEQCAPRGVAYGTAYGNLAWYACSNDAAPPEDELAIVGNGQRFRLAAPVWAPTAQTIASLPRYVDERRAADAAPAVVELAGDAVRIRGTQWPGIETHLDVRAGQPYLLSFDADGARPGDLLYLGRWDRPEVQTLSGGSTSGIFAPLAKTPWFPGDRAFVATSDRVWLRVYSEAPSADFRLRSITLRPLTAVDQ
jgi:4-amino-4-deoxy-L-arabinose transferase-like glycosyltransferase